MMAKEEGKKESVWTIDEPPFGGFAIQPLCLPLSYDTSHFTISLWKYHRTSPRVAM